MKRIKTGFFERRLELTKAGVVSSSRYFAKSATNMLLDPKAREQKNRELLAEQARYFVEELGKLKGSVVKIGQMMALYGKYFLPREITDALHSLEDDTEPMHWSAIRAVLEKELGSKRLAQLEIDETPLAAASLGQVHRATRKADGQQLCVKVQYPGIAKSIDSDFDAIIQLLTLARLVDSKHAPDEWFREIRKMLHQEVDYLLEAQKTQFVAHMLECDQRYLVPLIEPDFSTERVLTSTFEQGLPVTDSQIQELSLQRRNHIAKTALDLFLTELFDWGEMQTDPNFGNYRIRLDEENGDRLVLLDFGAMKTFSPTFLPPFRQMIKAAYEEDRTAFLDYAIQLNFMKAEFPQEVLDNFADIALEIIEPLSKHPEKASAHALNENGEYRWKQAKLPKRVAKKASQQSLSRYFALPPKEFMFLNRKLMGVYAFIMELEAEFNGGELLKKHLPSDKAC